MDHSHHDHSAHAAVDHDMAMCSMNMLFTWSTKNLCIVFRGWQITSTFSLIWSLLAIVALGAGYEALRNITRQYEIRVAERLENMPHGVVTESSSLLAPGKSRAHVEQSTKIVKAFLYALQVFYSFFIMLLFMTYNGWIMIAVAVGAFVGYLLFSPGPATKTVACH
ncbi:uncharacterized protein PV09_04958 [Verruconis gallopava]|uniref:Copper transport protein n=1 Tax=Verruconis gallopava TaxID=253628 RepID=A0A0D1XNK3_9PEZI|nr:uncharacterized protein PV09_04958 [Verruconis gallopava]KIW04151.1 hypothetical protein PV09_04958 [Verruconis gallopava]